MTWDALALALAQHAMPSRVPELRQRPLPEGMTAVLRAALAQDETLDVASAALRAPRAQIVEAARFFIEQQVLARDFEQDPRRQLGLSPDADADTVKVHHRLLVRLVHPDRSDDWAEAYADRVNRAWRQLRHLANVPTTIMTARKPSWGRPAAHAAVSAFAEAEPAAVTTARPRRWAAASAVAALAVIAFAIGRVTVGSGDGNPVGHEPDTLPPEIAPIPAAAADARVAVDEAAHTSDPSAIPVANLLPNGIVDMAALPSGAPNNAVTPTAPARTASTPTRVIEKERPNQADSGTVRSAEPIAAVGESLDTSAQDEPDLVQDSADADADLDVDAVTVTAATLPALPTDRETLAVLDRYAQRYAAGDLDGVMSLFAHNVHADTLRFAPIAQWHSHSFQSSVRRELQLLDVRWQRHSDRIVGEARYELSLQPRRGFMRRTEQGRIQFELVSEDGAPRLTQWIPRPGARS